MLVPEREFERASISCVTVTRKSPILLVIIKYPYFCKLRGSWSPMIGSIRNCLVIFANSHYIPFSYIAYPSLFYLSITESILRPINLKRESTINSCKTICFKCGVSTPYYYKYNPTCCSNYKLK